MSGWLAGRVVENRHWTDALFSLVVEAPPIFFEAGQFVRIALEVDGERIARPFSFVNPPGAPQLEFYGVVVPGGALSPRLARLVPGDRLWVSDLPSGFLVLSEVPDAQDLWLVATGTGIAPFLSMLATDVPWRRFDHVVFVHAVRRACDLVYRERIERFATEHHGRLTVIRFVSREAVPQTLAGRVPAAIADGRLEAAAARPISAARSQFLLCGNPAMVRDCTAALFARGLRKHRRRAPGQIQAENFW